MSELANVLLRQRLITRGQLEEAMDAQILNGGRLGTNLVELGFLSEKQLAEALQLLHKVPAVHGELVPHEAALQLIRPEWCDKHNLMPLRLEGQRLYIGLLSPYSESQLRTLGERLGLEVQQVLVPEFRMNQLLRRYAKAFRPVRKVDILLAPTVNAAHASSSAAGGQELMSEDDFQHLYAEILSGGRTSDLEAANAEQVERESSRPVTPMTGSSKLSSGALPAVKPVPPPEPMTPISFAEAQAALKGIHDREGVARVVMRFAAGKFARAILLNVHGDLATGFEGVGPGLAGERGKRVVVELPKGSPLRLVRDTCSHFLGMIRPDASFMAFFKLSGGAPQTALLMPILARGRVVNILYADHGPGKPTSPDLGELMILAQSVGRAYEDFLVKHRQAKLAALAADGQASA